ncbi:phosphoesterase RecJ-like protein [Clostridium moniliforme]|uniref:Phosphoesterase RecJ-like protein n=1 Tax=Clostridium moniliforme TaxID=39489 RepID=A0ABS4EWX9_9CLOT|nr:bifunctional oligoribonuclease/PAP phosphatase NrnA [Clostridium moniliforme]MBP1888504.1 phosphoesterase RecJ-like protein [Clostridium moniliforme]
MSLKDIKKIIIEANKIGITFHTSPDGDAIGSALGLLNGLRELGKEVYIISKDTLSEDFSFLPYSEEINGEVKEPMDGTDLVIVLDCGNLERISADLSNFNGMIINIDHHVSNDKYGFINYVDTKAAATAEIVFLLLKEIGYEFSVKEEILKKIGTCLYTSLITDTGSFRHSNVTKRTHEIAGTLIGVGVNNSSIYNNLFDNRSINKLNLMGYAFENAKLYFDGKVVLTVLDNNILKKFNSEKEDTSDIIGNLLSLKTVEVAILLKEVEEGVKCSLRSKYDFDVRKIAEVFGGGGHPKAAGLMQKGILLHNIKDNILKEIEREIYLCKE